MRINVIEVIVGAIVLAIAALFLIFAYNSTRWHGTEGYVIFANFDRVDGLSLGSDVRISGIKVGTVTALELDKEKFLARVKVFISSDCKIPKDSIAEIIGEGLLGPRFLSIIPGGSDEIMKAEGEIKRTQPPLSIESLISKFLFSGKNEAEKK